MQEEARRLQEGPALLPEGHHTEVDSSLTDTRHQTVTSAGVAGTQLGRSWAGSGALSSAGLQNLPAGGRGQPWADVWSLAVLLCFTVVGASRLKGPL